MRFLTVFLLFTAGLVGADTLLIKSIDAGRTWTDIDPGPGDRFLWWLKIDSRGSTLYALTQRDLGEQWHLSVSTDNGQTWQIRQSFPREIYRIVAAAAPGAPDTLYFAYRLHGYPQEKVMIAEVTDRGERMEQYRAEGLVIDRPQDGLGSSYASLVDLAAAPSAPSTVYALITNDYADDIYAFFQALWVSRDRGRNWERLAPPLATACAYPEMQIDPSDASVYLACGNDLFKSMDGGASWTAKPFPDGQRLWSLQIGPGARTVLYANQLGVIWKSIDGAETWQRLGTFPATSDTRFLTPHPVDPSLIFTGTRDGIAKSEDGGDTWTAVTQSPLTAEYPLRLCIDPQAPDTFYLVNWMRRQVRLGP